MASPGDFPTKTKGAHGLGCSAYCIRKIMIHDPKPYEQSNPNLNIQVRPSNPTNSLAAKIDH